MIDLKSARHWARAIQEAVLKENGRAVDATMGTGGDTEALCILAGEHGRVDAFDIQQEALDRTEARLREHGLSGRAVLHLTGHEHMRELVQPGLDLVTFNLGWLPGSRDKTITTHLETTLQALSAALDLLKKGGVITLCAYPGHDEGSRELNEILKWTESLPSQEVQVMLQRYMNQPAAPALIALVKLREQITLPEWPDNVEDKQNTSGEKSGEAEDDWL